MNDLEKNTVKTVAKLSPWLAPLPSAFFVARSAIEHFALPLAVGVVLAAVIETLGLSTVHTCLWLADYNANRRKTDPSAPTWIAIALGAVYLVTTLGLVVFLEVWPGLATYAPGLFPFLAVVGAVNLALIAQQERRERAVKELKDQEKAERQARRSGKQRSVDRSESVNLTGQKPSPVVAVDRSEAVNSGQNGDSARSGAVSLTVANQARRSGKDQALTGLLTFYSLNPGAPYSAAGEAVGRSKPWVVGAVRELKAAGKVRKNGHGVEVVEL